MLCLFFFKSVKFLGILELENLLYDAVGADSVLLEQDHRGSGSRHLSNAHLAQNQIAGLGDCVKNSFADASLEIVQ